MYTIIIISMPGIQFSYKLVIVTSYIVEPPNKGRFGTSHFVLC